MYSNIISALNVRQVLEYYGVKFIKGRFAICPFHNEKTPSFTYYDNRQVFYCCGCKMGGDVVNFVAKMFHMKNSSAAKKLSTDFNLGLFRGEELSEEEKRAFHIAQRKKAEREAKEKELRDKFWFYHDAYVKIDKITMDLGKLANKSDRRKFRGELEEYVLLREEYYLKMEHMSEVLDKSGIRRVL